MLTMTKMTGSDLGYDDNLNRRCYVCHVAMKRAV